MTAMIFLKSRVLKLREGFLSAATDLAPQQKPTPPHPFSSFPCCCGASSPLSIFFYVYPFMFFDVSITLGFRTTDAATDAQVV